MSGNGASGANGTNSAPRRTIVRLGPAGITSLHWQNPYVVLWWSASFPGFGHFVLQQYARGIALSFFEVIVNTLARINEGMVYTFCGQFELAARTVEPRWALVYLAIYLFAFWDSYRLTLENNKLSHLAEMENAKLPPFLMTSMNLIYLEKRKPLSGLIASLILPGLGQLYNVRFVLALYAMFWWILYATLSRSHEAFIYLLQGKLALSTSILQPHWLLFMPSVMIGSMYETYMTAWEHNRLMRLEQQQYFQGKYPPFDLNLFPEKAG